MKEKGTTARNRIGESVRDETGRTICILFEVAKDQSPIFNDSDGMPLVYKLLF